MQKLLRADADVGLKESERLPISQSSAWNERLVRTVIKAGEPIKPGYGALVRPAGSAVKPMAHLARDGNNAILMSIEEDNKAKLEQLLEESFDATQAGILGITPLHGAAQQGRTEMIPSLVKYNANVNARDLVGGSPIYYAATLGHTEAVKLLIDANSDLSISTYLDGKTPLDTAVENDHHACAALLRSALE